MLNFPAYTKIATLKMKEVILKFFNKIQIEMTNMHVETIM